MPFYKKIWQDAAQSLHADFKELEPGFWQVRHGQRSTFVHNYKVQIDDPVVLDMAGNKAFCYQLLKAANLPVPAYQEFTLRTYEKAEQFMEKHAGDLFVVKPSSGTSGSRGITTHVRSFGSCRRAAALASLYSDELIIERHIAGESYRILVLDGKVIQASRRRGVRLRGDGTSTIRELIDAENQCRYPKGLSPILPDDELFNMLRLQGLTETLVAEKDREVLVKGNDSPHKQKNREFRTVFDENVTNLISGELRAVAEKAARALHSRFAGVDIITCNPALPIGEVEGAIHEVNTTPGLHHNYNLRPDLGPPPATVVLAHLLHLTSERGRPAKKNISRGKETLVR